MNFQNYQNQILLTSSDTKRTLMHLFFFTNSSHRENWFQYVRRVYTTAINFPCISTLQKMRLLQFGRYFTRSSPGRYGWCGITKNIISSKQNKKKVRGDPFNDDFQFKFLCLKIFKTVPLLCTRRLVI